MITATEEREQAFRADKRRLQAQAIAHAIWDEIADLVPVDNQPEAQARLLETIYKSGVLLIRDEEREKLGLEPCDQLGWTHSERVQLRLDRAAAMAQMMKITLPVDKP